MINERNAKIALASVFFLYVLVMRTYDVASTFLMLGEQTRDWTIALGSITDLPLTGAPSTAGGRGFGPVYYWLLWTGRVGIGPFLDNLPHAGGITVALLQSIADVWLFIALSRRIHWAFALALCLAIASAPFDIAISSLIWNPPVSAALIKMATAMALSLNPTSPLWQVGMAAALAWCAVQAHLSGLFVAAPLLAALAFTRRLRGALVVAGVVLVLQIPFLVSVLRDPAGPAGPTTAIAGIINPKAVRPWLAYDTVTGITGNLLLPMSDRPVVFAVATLLLGLIVGFVYRRDLMLLSVSIGGVLTATLLFTTSTRNYDGYWFIPLTTALALTFGMAIAAIPSKTAVKWIGVAALLLVAWRQPARIEDSKRFFKYPQYETMVRGSRQLIMQAPVVRDIRVSFEVHPTMDRQFIYKILGGRIDGSALYTAVINADGSIKLDRGLE